MTRASERGPKSGPTARAGTCYFQRAALPLHSLVFLLPLLCVYEAGVRTWPAHPLVAPRHIQEFFILFGATGRFLPPLAVVAVLLSWHIARGDAWRVSLPTLGGMLAECVGLVAPLALALMAWGRWCGFQAGDGTGRQIIFSFGAGIYEELIFRLAAFALLDVLLIDALKLRKAVALPVIVVLPALLFSAYHYWGNEVFDLRTFAVRSVGGTYFGFIFLFRGFGVTAGTHTAYDIFVILLHSSGW